MKRELLRAWNVYFLTLKFERSEKFERSKIRVGSPGLKNPEASKFFLGPRDICAEHSCLSSKIIIDSEAPLTRKSRRVGQRGIATVVQLH